MDQLFLFFDSIRPLSPGLRAYIQSVLVRKAVKRKEIILQEGQTAKYIYFIERGVVRSFRYKRNGEKTSWIMKEGDLFVSVGSFFSQTPSSEIIEALEDCVLYCISYEQLEKAYEMFPEFNLHGRVILQYYYQLSEKRNEMREQPTIDRVEFLMTDQPDLVGRISDKILASYLVMAPETFSSKKSKYYGR